MKIAIAQFAHETNSYSKALTGVENFERSSWRYGEEMRDFYQGTRTYIGGMLDEAASLGNCDIVPIFAAHADPCGYITDDAWAKILDAIMQGLRAAAPFDAIALELHGAATNARTHDLEGQLLRQLRLEYGAAMPITSTLDLHGNITSRMAEAADVLLGVKAYPHIDQYETGRKALRMAHLLVKRQIRPSVAFMAVPLLIPTSTTLAGPAKRMKERCEQWEQDPRVLEASFYHGFPYMDVPDTGVSLYIATYGDQDLAQSILSDLVDLLWDIKDDFYPHIDTAPQAIAKALAHGKTPVVINEPSDNPGGGGPGDGTHLLAAMLAADVPGSLFCHLADMAVVKQAHAAGEGAKIDILLGGKVDQAHGQPLALTVRVLKNTLSDFHSTGPMLKGKLLNLGPSTMVQVSNLRIIITERKSQTLNDDLLRLHGVSFTECSILGIKSSQHFRAYFETAASLIVPADTPGIVSMNLDNFEYHSPVRVKYPLNKRLL